MPEETTVAETTETPATPERTLTPESTDSDILYFVRRLPRRAKVFNTGNFSVRADGRIQDVDRAGLAQILIKAKSDIDNLLVALGATANTAS